MSRYLSAFLVGLVCVWPAEAAAPAAKARPKLYVTNSAGDDVTVVDVTTNKPIGRIVVGPNPHGIAVPADQSFILVTIEGKKPGELVWIDPQTDKITRRMEVGPAPNQLAVTPDGKIAYVPCEDGYWDVVDVAKAKVLKRIFTGGRPHNTLCSPDGKRMYLAPMGSPKRVTIVEVDKHEVLGFISFSNVVRPIALTKDEKFLFAEVDGLVGFEYVDTSDRELKVHRVPAELSDEQKRTASRSHGLGIRPDQKEIWECDVNHHDVHVYDITGDKPKQIATIPIGKEIYWLTFTPDGKTCYVSARGGEAVAVVDTATKKVTTRIPVGKAPKRLIVVSVPEKTAG
jgi:YVTN family beta-propeller protein